jgi:hypothetical protein
MDIENEIKELKKRIELLESLVLKTQNKTSKNIGRDKTRYMFENKIYPKNRFVLAIIEKYVLDCNPTYEQLKTIFDKSLQGSLNVIEIFENAQKRADCNKRYFMQNPIVLDDKTKVVVCTQWGIFNIVKFEMVASNLGYNFDKI